MPESILKVKDLNVKLDNEKIIEGLSFEVEENKILVVLGPNGAGKTVLFKTLLGLLPFKGEIQWRPGLKIEYVPTGLYLNKDIPLTVEEFFNLRKVSSREALKVLKMVDMGKNDILAKRVNFLSSGQFQRLLIAWSLAGQPQVLLFDEPTAGIDVRGQESIYLLLDKLRKAKSLTVLLVTHDLSIVYKLADKVICLNKKVLCQGSPVKVLTPQYLSQLYGGEIKFYQHQHE